MIRSCTRLKDLRGALMASLTLLSLGLAPLPALAQWQTSGTNLYYSGGNVGIGTTSPAWATVTAQGGYTTPSLTHQSPAVAVFSAAAQTELAVFHSGYGSLPIVLQTRNGTYDGQVYPIALNPLGGNVGIGTTSPTTALDVNGVMRATANSWPASGVGLEMGYVASSNTGYLLAYDRTSNVAKNLGIGGSGQAMTISSSGNVGIGTTNPCANSFAPAGCKLSVAGTIQAQEIVVNTGWSDYVFRPQYHLRPLGEVAAYIQVNGHLPDIPSESEVKGKGIGVGEMESKLLAKIEELTLHMIRADERNTLLEQQNRVLQDLTRTIQEEIGALKLRIGQ